MNKKEKKEKISSRNYFLVIIVSILVIIIALYIRAFYINYNDNAMQTSVMDEQINKINLNEIGFTIPESGDIILYVSYLGDKNIHNMEKRLLKEINKKSLNEKIIYLDITNHLENNEYTVNLKKQFSNIENEITTAPMFIYIENGEAIEAFSSELKLIDYKIFNKIIDKYEIE